MKKLLIVLLSLGLLVAFVSSASALDVKFSGQYYVVGTYENNRTLQDSDYAYSRAAFFSRARVQTVFQVAEGLKFTTRFDAHEKQWGNSQWSSSTTQDKGNSRKAVPANVATANVAAQENIEFEQGYVTFATKIGMFDIGYQSADTWGTGFADTPGTRPRAKLSTKVGPLTLIAIMEKVYEADTSNATATSTPNRLTDGDADAYMLAGVYKWKGGDAGLLYKFGNGASTRQAANYRTQIHALLPYVKATFGPVYIESELVYQTGKTAKYESPSVAADIDKDGLGFYILGKVNLGPAYAGLSYMYSSGDNDATDTKDKTGPNTSTGLTPALFFGNANMRSWWYGSNYGGATATAASTGVPTYNLDKQNLHVITMFGGFNPLAKLKIEATLATFMADKKPVSAGQSYVSRNIATEADLTATYKIYDNLTYMVGAGYIWTGDYFKGTNEANKTGNDFGLVNQLTLNF